MSIEYLLYLVLVIVLIVVLVKVLTRYLAVALAVCLAAGAASAAYRHARPPHASPAPAADSHHNRPAVQVRAAGRSP